MLYEILDTRNPRLLDKWETIIEATTGRKAIDKYLENRDEHFNIENTSNRDVIWKVTPFYERDGKKYLAGRISWYGIKPIITTVND